MTLEMIGGEFPWAGSAKDRLPGITKAARAKMTNVRIAFPVNVVLIIPMWKRKLLDSMSRLAETPGGLGIGQ